MVVRSVVTRMAPAAHPVEPTRLVALIRRDQKEWLQSQVTPFRSLATVVRDIIDTAMAAERKGRR